MPLARVIPFPVSTSPRRPRFPRRLDLAKLLEVAERLKPDALALIIDSAAVIAGGQLDQATLEQRRIDAIFSRMQR